MQERINHRVALPVHHLQGAPEPLFQAETMIEKTRNRGGGQRGQKAIDGAGCCRDEKRQQIEPERERNQAPQEEPGNQK